MLGIISCGGSSGFTPARDNVGPGPAGAGALVQTGVFLDSAVEGMTYKSAHLEGTTDVTGKFEYFTGRTVSFYIGDILIGETSGTSTIVPVDLVPGATDETNPTVTNIARFLQTLDDDDIPTNGIKITSTVATLAEGKTINFSQTEEAFALDGNVQIIVSELTAATVSGARSLVSSSAAQAHLAATLASLDNP